MYNCVCVCAAQLPEAVHHHAGGQAGGLPGHVGAGVPHPAAGLQAQDEEPGVDQRHLGAGRGVPVGLRGGLLHRQGVCSAEGHLKYIYIYFFFHVCLFSV